MVAAVVANRIADRVVAAICAMVLYLFTVGRLPLAEVVAPVFAREPEVEGIVDGR